MREKNHTKVTDGRSTFGQCSAIALIGLGHILRAQNDRLAPLLTEFSWRAIGPALDSRVQRFDSPECARERWLVNHRGAPRFIARGSAVYKSRRRASGAYICAPSHRPGALAHSSLLVAVVPHSDRLDVAAFCRLLRRLRCAFLLSHKDVGDDAHVRLPPVAASDGAI